MPLPKIPGTNNWLRLIVLLSQWQRPWHRAGCPRSCRRPPILTPARDLADYEYLQVMGRAFVFPLPRPQADAATAPFHLPTLVAYNSAPRAASTSNDSKPAGPGPTIRRHWRPWRKVVQQLELVPDQPLFWVLHRWYREPGIRDRRNANAFQIQVQVSIWPKSLYSVVADFRSIGQKNAIRSIIQSIISSYPPLLSSS